MGSRPLNRTVLCAVSKGAGGGTGELQRQGPALTSSLSPPRYLARLAPLHSQHNAHEAAVCLRRRRVCVPCAHARAAQKLAHSLLLSLLHNLRLQAGAAALRAAGRGLGVDGGQRGVVLRAVHLDAPRGAWGRREGGEGTGGPNPGTSQ